MAHIDAVVIEPRPDFYIEAVALISDRERQRDQSILQSHDKFGLSEDEMREYIERVASYKMTVFADAEPLFQEYFDLLSLFCADDDELSFADVFAILMRGKQRGDGLLFWNAMAFWGPISLASGRTVPPPYGDVASMTAHILRAEASDTAKVTMLKAIERRDELGGRLFDFIASIGELCELHYGQVAELVEKSRREAMRDCVLLERLFSSLDFELFSHRIVMSAVLYNRLSVSAHDRDGKIFAVVVLGVHVAELARLSEEGTRIMSRPPKALRVLASQTSWAILAALRGGGLTQKEISSLVGVSQTEVSRHVEALLGCGLVGAETQEGTNRVVISQNRTAIQKCVYELSDLAGQ